MHTVQILSHRAGARSQTLHRLLDMLSAAAVRVPGSYSAFRRASRLSSGADQERGDKEGQNMRGTHGSSAWFERMGFLNLLEYVEIVGWGESLSKYARRSRGGKLAVVFLRFFAPPISTVFSQVWILEDNPSTFPKHSSLQKPAG